VSFPFLLSVGCYSNEGKQLASRDPDKECERTLPEAVMCISLTKNWTERMADFLFLFFYTLALFLRTGYTTHHRHHDPRQKVSQP